jgi:hypothetical protein
VQVLPHLSHGEPVRLQITRVNDNRIWWRRGDREQATPREVWRRTRDSYQLLKSSVSVEHVL